MHFISRLGLGLALSLIAGLSAPLIAPVVLSSAATSNRFADSFAQTQTVQAQATQAQTPAFSDVPADYWAHDYIQGLAKSNVISGFGDGTFRPNEPVSRAQFAAILRQAFLKPQPTTAQSFKDVPAGYWATGAIASARSAGFLSGYPGNRFAPNEFIIRRDALVSLASGLKYADGDPDILSYYWDADRIPDYALPKIRAAAIADIIVSYPNVDRLSLDQSASRADVAAFVYQSLVKAGRTEPLPAIDRWQRKPVVTLPTISRRMSLSQAGHQLATISDKATANGREYGKSFQIWNTQTGQLIKEISAPDQTGFENIAISHDGKQVALISGVQRTGIRDLSVWTVATGEQLWQKPLDMPQQFFYSASYGQPAAQVAFSPDNGEISILLVAGTQEVNDPADTQLRFYRAATGEIVQSLTTETAEFTRLYKVIFSPDGEFLASAQLGFVDIWQRNENNQFERFKKIPAPEDLSEFLDMVFTSSSTLNISTLIGKDYNASATAHLAEWNFQTDSQPSRIVSTDWYFRDNSSSLSPDGKFYFVQGFLGGERLNNVQTGASHSLLHDSSPFSAVFSEDGNYLAIAADESISIFTKLTSSNP